MKQPGITVQCVRCKGKKTLSFEEARVLDSVPFCDKCYMPMCAVSAHVVREPARKSRP